MLNRRWLRVVVAVLLLGGGFFLWRAFGVRWIEPHPGQYDNHKASPDLPRDLKLMWETQRLGGTPDPTHGPNPQASTDQAINAASRVFNTVVLVGKTREEVITLLGDPKTLNNSIYNFPFRPASKGALVFRFDSGSYGWQFNVVFGEVGKVQLVERHWIH